MRFLAIQWNGVLIEIEKGLRVRTTFVPLSS